jgi:hypothetical protein
MTSQSIFPARSAVQSALGSKKSMSNLGNLPGMRRVLADRQGPVDATGRWNRRYTLAANQALLHPTQPPI